MKEAFSKQQAKHGNRRENAAGEAWRVQERRGHSGGAAESFVLASRLFKLLWEFWMPVETALVVTY